MLFLSMDPCGPYGVRLVEALAAFVELQDVPWDQGSGPDPQDPWLGRGLGKLDLAGRSPLVRRATTR